MLTLSRKVGSRLKVGSAVIVFRAIKGTRITISIDAPRDVPINRLDEGFLGVHQPETIDLDSRRSA